MEGISCKCLSVTTSVVSELIVGDLLVKTFYGFAGIVGGMHSSLAKIQQQLLKKNSPHEKTKQKITGTNITNVTLHHARIKTASEVKCPNKYAANLITLFRDGSVLECDSY